MHTSRYALALCISLAFSAITQAQTATQTPEQSVTSPTAQTLAKQLEELRAGADFPGFAVMVAKGDKIVFAQGFGVADRASKVPYTINTIQPVASVSKTVVGVALAKCIELQRCNLDADINASLPFKLQNPKQANAVITLRHLATHTSGLVDSEQRYRGTYVLGTSTQTSLSELLTSYYAAGGALYSQDNFANTAPGSTYAYSNIATSLAAYVIERNMQMPFDQFTQQQVFDPLKLTSTSWRRTADTTGKTFATLYEVNAQSNPLYQQVLNPDRSLKPYTNVSYPDGSLNTNASDLMRFMLSMRAGYLNNTSAPAVLSAANTALMLNPQYTSANMPANMDRREPNRALFWAYGRDGSIRHTGSDPGVFAFISYRPKQDITRVFVMNTQLEGDDNVKAVTAFSKMVAAMVTFEEQL